ncbi:MAG: helix-turn-helix transcriptional regulator [Clostridiales bacterium]
MSVSYKKLWMLILERDMKKTEVRIAAGISPSTFSKMNRNEYVAMEVLVKLCKVLNCNIGDIVDVIHNSD